MPEDQTPLISSFMTAILQMIFLAMLYILFQGTLNMGIEFFVMLFIISLIVSGGVYYMAKEHLTTMILYASLLAVFLVLAVIFFGSLLGFEPTMQDIGFLVLASMFSGLMASWLGASLTSRLGIGAKGGFLALPTREEKKRRVIRK